MLENSKISTWGKIRQFLCFNHKYTNNMLERGQKPDEVKIAEYGPFKAWVADTTMYCKKCGHIPQVTLDHLKKCAELDRRTDLSDREKIVYSVVDALTTPPNL